MPNGILGKLANLGASDANSNGDTRDHIGITVIKSGGLVLAGLVVVIVIAIAVLSWSGAVTTIDAAGRIDTKGLSAEDAIAAYFTVLTTVLPVIATWVGTVLAFYFTRENFKAASEATQRLVESVTSERLQSISVAEVMVRFKEIDGIIKFSDVGTTKTSDLIKKLAGKVNLLIVADTGQIVKHVIHDSLVYRYKANAPSGTDPLLSELLADAEYAAKVSAIGFVDSQKTLADVQTLMETIPDCRDVFITSNGQKDGEAIGWITDRIIAQKAKA